MPKLTASLETATSLQPLEKAFYIGHISAQKIDFSKKTGAPMVGLQVEVDEGDYRGRYLPGGPNSYFFTMAGGKKEDGTPYDLGRLFDLINSIGAYWTCPDCGQSTNKKFVKEKGRYFTPCCGKSPHAIEFDTDTWVGLRARWQVDVEKMQDSDDMRNVIKGARPLE